MFEEDPIVFRHLANPPIEDSPAYDNMPISQRGSNPGRSVYKWRIPIEMVTPEMRDQRVLDEPMERILEGVAPFPPLPFSMTKELVIKKGNGDESAKEALILHNMRLGIYVGKRLWPQAKRLGVPYADMVQMGFLGLIDAIEKTDPDRIRYGGSLPSFIGYAVFSSIQRELAKTGRLIRLPAQIHHELQSIDRIKTQLEMELGRNPTTEELTAFLPWAPARPSELPRSEEEIETGDFPEYVITRMARRYGHQLRDATDETKSKLSYDKRPASLETILYAVERFEDGESTNPNTPRYRDAIADEFDLDAHIDKIDDQLFIDGLFATDVLSYRERRLLELRYGLDGEEPRTLDDIGRVFNVTRERIRQIKARSLQKILSQYHLHGVDPVELSDRSNLDKEHKARYQKLQYERRLLLRRAEQQLDNLGEYTLVSLLMHDEPVSNDELQEIFKGTLDMDLNSVLRNNFRIHYPNAKKSISFGYLFGRLRTQGMIVREINIYGEKIYLTKEGEEQAIALIEKHLSPGTRVRDKNIPRILDYFAQK